jgi:hypothetical protein
LHTAGFPRFFEARIREQNMAHVVSREFVAQGCGRNAGPWTAFVAIYAPSAARDDRALVEQTSDSER